MRWSALSWRYATEGDKVKFNKHKRDEVATEYIDMLLDEQARIQRVLDKHKKMLADVNAELERKTQ